MRYKSQMAKTVAEEYGTKDKLARRTMGEAKTTLHPPEEFLRKKTREVNFQQRAKSARARRKYNNQTAGLALHVLLFDFYLGDTGKYCNLEGLRRPPVPKVTDHVATPLRHRRNFVTKNAVDVMCSKAVNPTDPQFVDSPNGNTQPIVKSGMVPVHMTQNVRISHHL